MEDRRDRRMELQFQQQQQTMQMMMMMMMGAVSKGVANDKSGHTENRNNEDKEKEE